MPDTFKRVPVTVITGFLGSGKTTLLNRILSENHGKRIAVIENEFGEVGIDHQLVIQADEEIFEMNNGCICCTVRGDLIRILGKLMQRRDKFDYIIIETTGLADPGPVAQTFFVDQEVKEKLALDGIVTVVDAKHIWQHIDESDEAKEQVAFADVILLNKTDLVPPHDLDKLESRIRSMNGAAQVYRTKDAAIDLNHVLGVGGFNLNRALEVDPKFMEPEYPFEWGGIYDLKSGKYEFVTEPGPDPAMDILLLPAGGTDRAALKAVEDKAVVAFSGEATEVTGDQLLRASENLRFLKLEKEARFLVPVDKDGAYALFSQHHPDEFQAKLIQGAKEIKPVVFHEYKPDHEHDEEVGSVGITTPGNLDPQKFDVWLGTLLRQKGVDIFRMKGVVSIKGDARRFVFQGVHMLFDGRPDRPWGEELRQNALIFIGRNLNRSELTDGFKSCLTF
ncbi:MAG TPA: GTP-binding protein [Candidatus Methylacidiphilales bacterium]|nr:GTP-binding protein [Candidatus Methylacidiphilales bacterium]